MILSRMSSDLMTHTTISIFMVTEPKWVAENSSTKQD